MQQILWETWEIVWGSCQVRGSTLPSGADLFNINLAFAPFLPVMLPQKADSPEGMDWLGFCLPALPACKCHINAPLLLPGLFLPLIHTSFMFCLTQQKYFLVV